VFEVPVDERFQWIEKFRGQHIPDVLRLLAQTYSIGRHDLGFAIAALAHDVSTAHVQAVWHWDIERCGRGLSDDELMNELANLRF